jgi:CPA2 family monovalent cation:H+ antiporter-2
MAHDFAEVGVILLMFGVGLHFKFNDLLAVRRIAIPGPLGQILVASTLGTIAALSLLLPPRLVCFLLDLHLRFSYSELILKRVLVKIKFFRKNRRIK